MSSDIAPYSNRGYTRLPERRVARGLDRINADATLGVARIAARAELQATRVAAVSHVATRALHDVALVSQLEGQLAQIVPLAASRLQGIADMAALGMADVVADTVRRLDRC